MTPLDEIIELAKGDTPLSQVLRAVKVVASYAESTELLSWCNLELRGYPDEGTVPSYRGPFDVELFGDFWGPYGVRARNARISPRSLPEWLRRAPFTAVQFHEGIGEIEDHASNDHRQFGWPSDIVDGYNVLVAADAIQSPQPGMQLKMVKMPVGRSQFVGILEAVRNEVLDLALELRRAAPDAGLPDASPSEKQAAGDVITNNNFFLFKPDLSGSNNAVGSASFEQSRTDVVADYSDSDGRPK